MQTIFALKLGNVEHIYLTSLLLMLGMIGGIIANTVFSQFVQKVGVKKLVFLCLVLEALLIIVASFLYSATFYLAISFLLGLLGGMLWSAVLIMIPMITNNDAELEVANKYAHLIRNMGFMVGPIIGGFVSAFSSDHLALLLVGSSTLLASLMIMNVPLITDHAPQTAKKAINGFSSIPLLLQEKRIKRAMLPLIFTIMFTSTLSVLIIVYITDIIKLEAEKYGVYVATISLSLAIAPILLSKLGEATAACLCAAGIGLGLLMLSLTENYLLLLCWGMFMGGVNGLQNTIMSAFMLKNIPAQQRENYMPAYVLILQLCVFIGFLISMIISSEYFAVTFLLLGSLTIFFGVTGAIFNLEFTI